MKEASKPIGILDSGVGGLTVACELKKLLPQEKIIYFGDTARFPYGGRSEKMIYQAVEEIIKFLTDQSCKIILIACNTATAVAYSLLKKKIYEGVKIVNVIDPMVKYLGSYFEDKRIGLIATEATIKSRFFETQINELGKDIKLNVLATPLLAPLIENGGKKNSKVTDALLAYYLRNKELADIEALILGCTHYSLLKNRIENLLSNQVQVLDASKLTAMAVKQCLEDNGLLNKELIGRDKFFVSDYTIEFRYLVKLFFNESIELKHLSTFSSF